MTAKWIASRWAVGGWAGVFQPPGRAVRFLACLGLLACLAPADPAQATPLTALPVSAYTLPNQPVAIAVLAGDSDGPTNQLAVLKVSAPAHGTVVIVSNAVPLNPLLASLYQFSARQLSNSVAQVRVTNMYPRSTLASGVWKLSAVSDWIPGFFPGAMWYLYEQGGDPHFRTWAQDWTADIATQQNVTDTDDLGFMINNSFGNGYRLTGNPAYEPIIVQAAESVVQVRYDPVVGCIGDDDADNTLFVIIDSMLNLELLFNASNLGGDHTLYTDAFNHAKQTMLNHVRTNGSTYQTVTYNRSTGAVLSKGNRDGYSPTSVWGRGQAWAIYGFTMAYRETGDLDFLVTAQRVADFFITNLPPDVVPYWDFDAPDIPAAPRDSSAAAISLSGLVQLSQMVTNLQDSARYWQAANQIFSSLASTNYLSKGPPSSGILLHGTGEPPGSSAAETNVSLIYGDYYFIEALRRYTTVYGQTTLLYTPATNYTGNDSFTCEVCDSAGACSNATVTIAVDTPLVAQISVSPDFSQPAISFPTVTNRHYSIQYSDDLANPAPWNVLATNLAGSGSIISFVDTNFVAERFYRVGMTVP